MFFKRKREPEKNIIVFNKNKDFKHRLMIGIPTLGIIRYEWSAARYSQIIPINWSVSEFALAYAPIGFNVDDAYNVIVKQAVEQDFEWLLCWEDDVIAPNNTFLQMTEYVKSKEYPVVSGLYYTKGFPSEPLLFRGRGNGAYYDWELGERIMVDGVPMGMLLIHMSLLRYLYENSEDYTLPDGQITKRVFESPRRMEWDLEKIAYQAKLGTQDLYWCDRVMKEGVLAKCGWTKIARKKYPFLVDTNIFCKHIDLQSGIQYPN